MKHSFKLMLLAATVSMAACTDNSTTSTTTTTDSNADTHTTMASAPDQNMAADSGMAGSNNNTGMTATAMTDQEFVTKASSGNTAEVAAHKAAQTHGMSADVKMHAKHMLADHQKMGDEMKALAGKKGLTVSTEPPADKKQMLDDMNANKKGKDWDVAYLDAQVKDHEETISLFETGSASVKDADLKAMIDKTLPTLRSHLQMVKDAQAKMNQ